MYMNPEEMIQRARWMAEHQPVCDLCDTGGILFRIGVCIVCKDCLIDHLFENIGNPDTCEALRLYVDSDPNAADWFGEYFDDCKITDDLG